MKPKLKIVHTESHRSWGGQEIRVLNECLWMKGRGHYPLLVAPPKSQIFSRASDAGLTVIPMTFNNLTMVADLIRLRKLLKCIVPDVLNTHGNMDAKVGLFAARGLNIPCVIRSRHHTHPVSDAWHNKWMYNHLSDYIFTAASCVSDQLARDLGVDPSRVKMVPTGIIPPKVLPARKDALEGLRRELNLDQNARFIGSVAMLRLWKGHRYLLDGFATISDRFNHHHLVIVGDGDEMGALLAQRQRLGLTNRIHFTGFRDDPWPYFRAFDLKVLASTKNELVSQVLPQAMYAQCPVIGTRVGGIPDLIEDGVNGLLAEPEDAGSLADAMVRTLIALYTTQARVRRALTFVTEGFLMDAMGERTLELYDRAFDKKNQIT